MQSNQQDKIIKFEDVKEDILKQLQEPNRKIVINEPVSLVDGFVSQPFSTGLSNSVVIGDPTIPMIMLLGNNSGQVYFFALKAILKDYDDRMYGFRNK
jgi:hypothetical protein